LFLNNPIIAILTVPLSRFWHILSYFTIGNWIPTGYLKKLKIMLKQLP